MQLLPGNRVLIATESEIEIHDMASIGTTTSVPPADFPLRPQYPLPTWEFQIRGDRLSQPYLCRKTNTLRFVLHALDTVYGLIIPVDAHLGPDPKVVMLMDFSVPHGGEVFLFGYNSAIIYGNRASDVHMLDYSWPGPNDTVSPANSLIVTLDGDDWMDLTSDFDEVSSRMVMCSCSEVVVFDFSTL